MGFATREIARDGMILRAIAPGHGEGRFVARNHMIDLNLGDERAAYAFDSDRMRERMVGGSTFAYSPPGTEFRVRTDNRHEGLLIEVEPARFEILSRSAFDGRDPALRVIDYAADPTVAALAGIGLAHMRGGEANDGLAADALGIAVIARVLGQIEALAPAEAGVARGDRRIVRAIDYIDANIDRDLDLATLAGIACLSVFHFSRCFRRATGETPQRFVRSHRLRRAQEMLRSTDLAIADVAQATGFASQAHLTSTMRTATGHTPAAYRRATQS